MYKHILFVLAAFGACAAPAFAADGCSLVSKSEASKFLGAPVAILQPASNGGWRYCRYLDASKNQNIYITVDAAGDAAQQLGSLKGHAQRVSGIGTTGYFVAGTLFAQKGRTLVSVAIYKNRQSIARMDPQLMPLARLVLSRL